MSKSTDWMPNGRSAQLNMAKEWISVLHARGVSWNIDDAKISELEDLAEAALANPDDLRHSFFTKRKKDVIGFDFGDSGKTAHFAVQIENEGKKGPWGPLTSALIP
ncbi:MAG: hypothetical protein Pg6C_19720 [Treponemataceae bacterium]|nr:MAG: hypothetical protein Pg6C_19720 [Treponemataceae bacterium]